mgnify:CR=1 FL=1
MHSASLIVGLYIRWVVVLFWLHIRLWWQLIHLFVSLSCLWGHFELLVQVSVLVALGLESLHHSSLVDEGSLELSWLWVESVVVSPFLFQLQLLVEHKGRCTDESEDLKVPEISEQTESRWSVDVRNLSTLKSKWEDKKCSHVSSVVAPCLVLKEILVFQGFFRGEEEPQVVQFLGSIGHY